MHDWIIQHATSWDVPALLALSLSFLLYRYWSWRQLLPRRRGPQSSGFWLEFAGFYCLYFLVFYVGWAELQHNLMR